MADDAVAQFTSITGSTPATALQYLQLSDENLEQAIQLFFDSGGIDLQAQEPAAASASISHAPPPPAPSSSLRTRQGPSRSAGRVGSDGIVHIDSDDEIVSDDDEPQITGVTSRSAAASSGREPSSSRAPMPATPPNVQASGSGIEDDEALARRMQEELYAGGDTGLTEGNFGGAAADGVRAPIARTTETLVGPGADMGHDMAMDMRAAVEAQMAARRQRAPGRPGIFNQRAAGAPSVWDDEPSESSSRREVLARATGGASEASSKANLLAEMYRPPHEIMSHLGWDDARQEGKNNEKWILVNVQDPSVFDCQVLNRDIWKNAEIKETVKENFIFMQYNKDDPNGAQYVQFYFKDLDDQDAYPHIAIVDPRTGEQVKVWSGPPVPKPMDYLMQLHEFLDRYSLKANAKNPVATRKAEPKRKKVDPATLSEEKQLEMALQASLGNTDGDGGRQPGEDGQQGSHPSDNDPDALTRGDGSLGKGKGKATITDDGDEDMIDANDATIRNDLTTNAPGSAPSAFSLISSSSPHEQPSQDTPTTTRIQFRHSGGRIIHRFEQSDSVRRLYEFLKSGGLGDVDEDKRGMEFELVCMGRNLIDDLDKTLEEAGMTRSQNVMLEFVEE